MLLVGFVNRPHGLQGEVSVAPETDFPERFVPGLSLVWRRGGEQRALTVASVRPHGRRLLVRFEGVEDAEAARVLAGGELSVAAEAAHPAPPDFYYSHEVEGWPCVDASGRELGRVARLGETAAGPLLEVEQSPGKSVLVPFVRPIVAGIDRAARHIVLDPPEGLFEPDAGRGRTRES